MNIIKITPRPVMPDLSGLQSKTVTGKDNDDSFGDFLSNALENVNTLQQESGESQDALVRGEAADLHQVMIAAEKAGISFDLLLEVRRKLLEAYQEIIRMPM
ncbi:MAG: flagellar hook-basal body complex protein FliE [candidate division Zixibacteria bacterium]|nr:flagellar hook-basal body complex protein FliE [candidate division Zixibacteria bacterium]